MGLFNSIIKSYKLKRISNILVGNLNESIGDTISNFFDGDRSTELNNAILDLYYLAKKDPTTRPLLNKYKIDKNLFRDLYWLLIKHHFAGHRKGHYIPASTLVFGDTLEYVLRVKSNPNLSMDDAKYRVIRYFDRNEIGEIKFENEEDALQKNEESQYSQLNKVELISKAKELMFPLKILSDVLEKRLVNEFPEVVKLSNWGSFQNIYIVAASAVIALQLHYEVFEDDRTEVELAMRASLSEEIDKFEELYVGCGQFIKEAIIKNKNAAIFIYAAFWTYTLISGKENTGKGKRQESMVVALIAESYQNSTAGYWNDIE